LAEKVRIRQNADFETHFWAVDPETDSDEFNPVRQIYGLTPYGMLLASLGSCTAVVVNTYARHHEVDLEEVELELTYARVFADDCEKCEDIDAYEEQIREEIRFSGDLTSDQHDKLVHIAHQCSIHKMLESGIVIESSDVEE
jgi:putative redox protein